jgi:O-antigen/teichoic acid export membrane protein
MKNYILHTTNIPRSSYLWNSASGMLMAFQSVIMLIVLTHTIGLAEAGIFTIAYANANLMLSIGKYGMRNFQISDSIGEYQFREYRNSRIITSSAMMIVALSLAFYLAESNGYSSEKTTVIIVMCVFKLVDVVEDVYYGLYQQKGRLDVAGKCLTLRMTITIFIFAVCLILFRDLLFSLVITTAATVLLAYLLIAATYHLFKATDTGDAPEPKRAGKIGRLLMACLPLFLGAFMTLYIGNAPKYAIDALLDDQMQACYGFLSMPIFVISLLGNFIFNPMIADLSKRWNAGESRIFKRTLARQLLNILMITATCLLGGYFLGIPVLSFMYNTDLSPYLTELLILLISGGFLAVSMLFTTAITIIRYQIGIAIVYAIVAALAFILSPILVARYAITGAVALYFCLMIVQCLLFSALLWFWMRRRIKDGFHIF